MVKRPIVKLLKNDIRNFGVACAISVSTRETASESRPFEPCRIWPALLRTGRYSIRLPQMLSVGSPAPMRVRPKAAPKPELPRMKRGTGSASIVSSTVK